jgi:hypothetical protein
VFVATVWAGVVAAQRPITCPNRQLQPKRYVPYFQIKIKEYFYKIYENISNNRC